MEDILNLIRQYSQRIREASFELMRDPYMSLAECDFTRRALGSEESISGTTKKRLERELREVEMQATHDFNLIGYLGIAS